MDKKDLMARLEEAIKSAGAWSTDGWTMTFGPRKYEVSNLKAAEESPDSFVYRQEALAYWGDIDEMGKECVACGEKARAALEKDDFSRAFDAVYFAKFTEKKFNKKTPTWGEISDLLQEASSA